MTHHQSGTKLYDVWCAAKARCNNPKNKNYKHYGGRGIKVCDEWENSFQAFYEWAMANGYKEGLSIDRIDNDGNYEPANCRWVTQEEQCNNRRTSHKLTYEGETHTITEWSKITGIKRKIISQRVNNLGWSIERALTEKEELLPTTTQKTLRQKLRLQETTPMWKLSASLQKKRKFF